MRYRESTAKRLVLPALAVLSTAVFLHAQQAIVVPGFADTREGNSTHAYPLSYTQARMQMIVDATELGSLRVINNLSFRPDGGGTTNSFGATSVPLQLTLYQVPVNAAQMSTTWATNIGSSTGTQVYNGTLNLPAFTVQYPLPNPWTISVAFTAPFFFVQNQGNLLIDWQAISSNYVFSRYNIDAVSYPVSPASLVTRVFRDTSCSNSRGDSHSITLTRSTGVLGGQIDVTSTPVLGGTGKLDIQLLFLGATNKTFGSIPLPIPIGASHPGCSIAIEPLLVLPASPAIMLPNNPALADTHLYFQGFAADSTTGDWVLSQDAWSLRILDNPPKGQGFQSNFLARYVNQTSGSMSVGFYYAPVMKIN
ncbi:MAG: hypothetical protein H6834_17555 [Planctomycetes bacterium]|nr:hypothetical protein [Planctomycetota bacterium]